MSTFKIISVLTLGLISLAAAEVQYLESVPENTYGLNDFGREQVAGKWYFQDKENIDTDMASVEFTNVNADTFPAKIERRDKNTGSTNYVIGTASMKGSRCTIKTTDCVYIIDFVYKYDSKTCACFVYELRGTLIKLSGAIIATVDTISFLVLLIVKTIITALLKLIC